MVMGMRKEVRMDIATAGVSVTDAINLYVNPHFWNSLTFIQQAEVMEHECLHVVYDHFSRRENRDPKLFNMGADAAINQQLPNLPRTVSIFDKNGLPIKDKKGKVVESDLIFPENYGFKMEQTAEYYYEAFKQLQKENKEKNKGKPGQGNGDGLEGETLDDHSIWDESNPNKDYVQEKIKSLVKKSEVAARRAGNFPGNLEKLVDHLFYKPKDWRSDLQRFVSRSSEVLSENSRMKRNRRYGIMYPGVRKYPKLHLGVVIDSSGSVNDECLNQAMAEINRIHKNNVKVTVIECDAAVQQIYDFNPKKKYAMKGRGGTIFQPGIDAAVKEDVDAIIFITDGEDGGNAKKPSIPVLWALYDGCDVRYKWGAKTMIQVSKKGN